MQKTLKEIAEFLGGQVSGDARVVIKGVSGIREAEEGDLTFLANPKYLPLIESTRACAIITPLEVEKAVKPIIRMDNPSLAFAKVISWMFPCAVKHPEGISKNASISKSAKIGKGAAIGDYAVLSDNAEIGPGSVIYPGVFIGHDTKIGENCIIYANASIRERISIGKRAIIHSGAVIGSDGFGFIAVEGRHEKIPQVGTVEIADDVEIGANVCIDRARFDKTVIGRGTKIDNLVHIAHNVIVGENSLIVAQAGISGSTVIGNNVTIAGQAGLVGHIKIGDGAILAAQAGVTKSVVANMMVSGYPAQPHKDALKINACIQNLPRLYETIKELKKKIGELEKKIK